MRASGRAEPALDGSSTMVTVCFRELEAGEYLQEWSG